MPKEISSKSEIPSTGLVVIDFFAPWCGPCKRIAPVFEELETHFSSVTFLKVNVDEAEELSQEFSVQSLPTFVFLKNYALHSVVEGADLNRVIDTLKILTK